MAHNSTPGDTLWQLARERGIEPEYWIFLPVAPVTIAAGIMFFQRDDFGIWVCS